MPRAPKICSYVDKDGGCPNTQPCPIPGHTRQPWTGSRRDERVTLSGSGQQRRARRILARYGGICHVCGKGGATVVDHVIPLGEDGPDDDTNLRPIHARPCHVDKTAAESARAKARR